MKLQKVQIKETVDRRCLGALRILDNATGNVVRRTLNIGAPGLRLLTNSTHLQVITYAKGLERHLVAFEEPPEQPIVGAREFILSIQDPLREYLPRTYKLKLPRRSKPQDHNSIFDPVDIRLYSASNRALNLNWCVIRASVFEAQDQHREKPLRGALLRATYGQDDLVAEGLSDKRGEAIIIVPGVPITTFVSEEPVSVDPSEWRASGAVVELETSVRIEIIVAPKEPWPVDPEELALNISVWQRQLKLQKDGPFSSQVEVKVKTGERRHINVFVQMP